MLGYLFASLLTVAAVLSAGHALLSKRDPRAALGWIALCLFLPGVGVAAYWLLGVNRIRTRARVWENAGRGIPRVEPPQGRTEAGADLEEIRENLRPLLHLSDAVTRRPLLGGNRITPLHNGEQAYPEMLTAIEGACQSVYLASYIFETNVAGRRFVEALRAASGRGVRVLVLVDALGELYSLPTARRLLRGSGVRITRFLPPSVRRGIYLNLRNHRKLLVVDGKIGFTGGMNLGDRHLAEDLGNPRRVVDIHFRVEGPVVNHLQQAFLEDWGFATGEEIAPDETLPSSSGSAFCRGISSGPNEDFEKLGWLFQGALGSAREQVRIMTPYFIPDRTLVAALNLTALRGVTVDLVLPARSNLPYVDWASRAYLWELLQHGVRIFLQPPPFAHSKLFLIDEDFALVGSANLDPRSLRLNFEFELEVFDHGLASQLVRHFDGVRDRSRPVSLADMDDRPLPAKLRDAACKLFSPYL